MPLIASTYRAKWPFTNAHVNTIYPAIFRSVPSVNYERETISTPDGDFLDIDWVRNDHKRLLIGLHGLEGNTERPYLRAIFNYFMHRNWDVLGINFRSCSGRMNQRLRMYNMGESHDLQLVVSHAIAQGYEEIALTGFSLGGGVVLKYLGEGGSYLPPQIKTAVVFSVPCDLPSANEAIAHWQNRLYLRRFMITLNNKLRSKSGDFPSHLQLPRKMPSGFADFDGGYTGPIHGYEDAFDYWNSCSSVHFLPNIKRPALIINALDDTFLGAACYPEKIAKKSKYVHLETPAHGGHCGFYSYNKDGSVWNEQRALNFVSKYVS